MIDTDYYDRRPCSDSRHVTAPYKSASYYYYSDACMINEYNAEFATGRSRLITRLFREFVFAPITTVFRLILMFIHIVCVLNSVKRK